MILEFDGIQFGFDEKQLLSGIYIKCETGKVTGLLGRNGSGKSTLLKIVFGSLYTDVISVRIDGKPLSPPSYRSRQIAYLPQDNFIPNDLSLQKILQLYEVDEDKILQPFPELKDDLALRSDEVSGGRLRLFEVLLILYSKAVFCLLDEPFTGLTPVFVERLQSVINNQKVKKGILVSDHLYRQVIDLSDSLYLLTEGKTYLVQDINDLVQRGYLLE